MLPLHRVFYCFWWKWSCLQDSSGSRKSLAKICEFSCDNYNRSCSIFGFHFLSLSLCPSLSLGFSEFKSFLFYLTHALLFFASYQEIVIHLSSLHTSLNYTLFLPSPSLLFLFLPTHIYSYSHHHLLIQFLFISNIHVIILSPSFIRYLSISFFITSTTLPYLLSIHFYTSLFNLLFIFPILPDSLSVSLYPSRYDIPGNWVIRPDHYESRPANSFCPSSFVSHCERHLQRECAHHGPFVFHLQRDVVAGQQSRAGNAFISGAVIEGLNQSCHMQRHDLSAPHNTQWTTRDG